MTSTRRVTTTHSPSPKSVSWHLRRVSCCPRCRWWGFRPGPRARLWSAPWSGSRGWREHPPDPARPPAAASLSSSRPRCPAQSAGYQIPSSPSRGPRPSTAPPACWQRTRSARLSWLCPVAPLDLRKTEQESVKHREHLQTLQINLPWSAPFQIFCLFTDSLTYTFPVAFQTYSSSESTFLQVCTWVWRGMSLNAHNKENTAFYVISYYTEREVPKS